MISKISKKLDVVANILIIVVALLLIGVIVQRYFFVGFDKEDHRVTPTIGKPLNLPNENFATQNNTIVLALATTCRFCSESAPFYKRLIESTKGENIKIVAVFPQPVEESTAYLNKLGLTGIEVKQAPISTLDTSGTPTLILTNQKGEVVNYWIGKLTPDKETEVINQISSK